MQKVQNLIKFIMYIWLCFAKVHYPICVDRGKLIIAVEIFAFLLIQKWAHLQMLV